MRPPRAAASRLALAALLAASCRPAPPRDILLVTLDTTRADRLGSYGGPAGLTPALDRLAARSSVFLSAACQVPITTPSHATILSGLLPPAHGVRDNGSFALPGAVSTLAERLHAAGFRSHAVLASFALDRRFGLGQGFDSYDDAIAPPGRSDLRAERRAGEVIDRGLAWLDGARSPAFLWLHLYDPHHPYAPPPPFAERFRDRPYDGEIAYLDGELGRLLEALERRGRLERSLIVVVGDHGEALGEHGERFHGTLLFDATLRVPLLVKWPGRGPRGKVTGSVGTHDIVPTVLAALGLPPDPGLPGRDLRRFAEGHETPGRGVYSESLTAELHYGWSRLLALRTERFKLLRGVGRRLYEHAADPEESRDRGGEMSSLLEGLTADLAALESSAPVAVPAADRESAEKLAALGYLSPGGSSAGSRAIDPVEHIALENLLLDALDREPRDPAAAIAAYQEALRREPGMKLALLRLAEALERAHDATGALARAAELLARYPDVEPAWSLRLRLLARSGRFAEARVAALAGLETLPGSDALRVDLAGIERALGNLEAARAAAGAVAKDSLERPRACYQLAAIAATQGDPRAALDLLGEALAGGFPPDPAALARDPAFANMIETPPFRVLLSAPRPSGR